MFQAPPNLAKSSKWLRMHNTTVSGHAEETGQLPEHGVRMRSKLASKTIKSVRKLFCLNPRVITDFQLRSTILVPSMNWEQIGSS